MCFSSQGAAANPDSEEQQQKLREAAEGLRIATNAAAQNAIKKRLVNKLEVKKERGKTKNFRNSGNTSNDCVLCCIYVVCHGIRFLLHNQSIPISNFAVIVSQHH